MADSAPMYKYGDELMATAKAIAAPGKGILAADESTGTIGKRFANIDVENNEANRLAYRGLLFKTEGLSEYISGVILYEETLYQKYEDGKTFVQQIQDSGVIAGIKVDLGTRELPFFPGEKYTQGLTDLDKRAARYYEAGARFAKWRCVLKIQNNSITETSINDVAWTLARYAAICQNNGLCPIIEPEILMDGDHSLATCQRMTEKTLAAVYKACADQNVLLEGSLLKPNMVLKGKECPDKNTFEDNALATVTALRRTVPPAVPGITFLSGGQTEEEATMNLNAINAVDTIRPWSCTFSFGRALQASVLQSWKGEAANVKAAQDTLMQRAKANSEANLGKYTGWAATEASKKSLYQKGYTY